MSFVTDLRQAFRALRSQRALTAVAVLSLAVGIAPTTVVFSVIDAVGFRPLPIPDPGGLVGVYTNDGDEPFGMSSYRSYTEIHTRTTVFGRVGAEADTAVGLSGDGASPRVEIASMVSGGYFAALGLAPARGRFIAHADDTGAGAPVAVISHGLWTRRFGSDPGIVGRTTRLNNTECTIVGVAPAGFAGTRSVLAPEVWVPIALAGTLVPGRPVGAHEPPNQRNYRVVARLRDGVTLGQARASVEALGRHLAEGQPNTHASGLAIDYEQSVRRRIPAAAGSAALAVISILLLTACANVAGLLLGRSEARRADIAIRLALGAGRWRILRQLLVEGMVLALVASAAALLLAFWLIRLIPALIPAMPTTVDLDLRLDPRVLVFTLLVAMVSVPLFALAPGLLASRPDLAPVLKGDIVRLGRLRWLTLRHTLVVGQIAVSLVLLVVSGLMTRSLAASRAIDPGFIRRPMLFSTMAPPIVGYSDVQTREFYQRLLDRLHATPGVERATLARHVPLNSLYGGGAARKIEIPGYEPPAGQDTVRVRYNVVGHEFLTVMGTRLVRGRSFATTDMPDAQRVVLVNQKMATTFWNGGDAVGRRLWLVGEDGGRTEALVVGVVQDAKYSTLNESLQPYLYVPYSQQYHGEMSVVVRVAGDERGMVAPFRTAIEALDPSMPTLLVTTLTEHLRMALFVERVAAIGAAVLGGLGLFLSMIGLHGVVAYQVSRRSREIGIRMALGADPGTVRAAVLRQSGRLVAVGVVIGLGVAVGVARVISASTFGVSALDPLPLAGGVLAVVVVSLLATWFPARRASRLDPVVTLRER
ncbi:MAG: ABC transporter permease [Vicinamibacterales bacterium]|nr:ABC transporter permease [Vicinamibacterales bacterium]